MKCAAVLAEQRIRAPWRVMHLLESVRWGCGWGCSQGWRQRTVMMESVCMGALNSVVTLVTVNGWGWA